MLQISKESIASFLLALGKIHQSLGQSSGEIVEEGEGFGLLNKDVTTKADKVIGEKAVELLQQGIINAEAKIYTLEVEGQGLSSIHGEEGRIKGFLDPLDGSLNDKKRGHAKGLPFSSVITFFDASEDERPILFSDIIGAGIIDLRPPYDLWIATYEGAFFTHEGHNFYPLRSHGVTEMDILNNIVIGEFYYPKNRGLLEKIFEDMKGWVRNPGSAGWEMAQVANGSACLYMCDSQKNHELGAGYFLAKMMGGVGVDLDGKDLESRPYVFNEQTPVILADTLNLAHWMVDRIQQIRKEKEEMLLLMEKLNKFMSKTLNKY